MYDVFISYAHSDSSAVDQLEAQLKAKGLAVWRDLHEIASFEDFVETIEKNLKNSKVLLAWYSEAYPQRPYCQWELATAHCAAPERVLVLSPHVTDDHIWPESLRGRKYGRPNDPTTIDRIVAEVKGFEGPLPLSAFPDARHWVGIGHKSSANTFVGRVKELWSIDDALRKDKVQRSVGITQVQGLAGMGKTMLAEEYARHFAARWPGGVYRGIASSGSRAADFHRSLIASIKGSDRAEACRTDEDAKRVAQDCLPKEPYLWLVDDLGEDLTKEQAEAWLAPTEWGHSLITTRSQKIDWLGNVIYLDRLSAEDAYDLLTRGRPLSDPEREAADAICNDLLGGHPLSVDVAGALYPEVYSSYGQLLQALKAEDSATLALSDELELILPTGHEPSILRTFAITLDRLKASKEMQVLRLAALLAPNHAIPRTLLEASLADVAPASIGIAIKKLCQRSLCHSDGQGGLTLHPVMGIVVRGYYGADDGVDVLPDLKEQAADAFIQLIDENAASAPPSCTPLAPHGYHLAEEPLDERAAAVLAALWWYLQHVGFYGPARAVGMQALEACRRVLGPEHPNTLTTMNYLAGTLGALGDHGGARELQEKALEAQNRILGPEHPSTLSSMNNLAGTLGALGDHGGARKLQEQALEATRRVLGPEHSDTLSSMNNLARTLGALGDYGGARELEEQVLEAQNRILGPEHPNTLTSMNNLALTLGALGDHGGARELEDQVLEARRSVLGPEHPSTLGSMNNLAATLGALGGYDGARKLQEQALKAQKRVLGPEHPSTLSSMNYLASTLGALGDHGGARELEEQVLEARRRVLGPEHPDTLTSMNNLAGTLGALGDHGGARELEEKALEVQNRILGPEHPSTLSSMNNLAVTLWALGGHGGARELQEQVLEAQRRVLGPEHPSTLTTMNNLVVTLWALGDHGGARKLQEQVLEARRRVLGSEHPATLASIEDRAFILDAMAKSSPTGKAS